MVALTKPEGIPTTSSSTITTRMAAIAAPAILKTLMSTFQPGYTAYVRPGSHPPPGRTLSLSRKTRGGSKGSKIIRGAAKLCDLWHTSMAQELFDACADTQRYCNE